MLGYWKRYEREMGETRKREQKEQMERERREEEQREARRQARKLNFLLAQTELFSHFMSSKIHVVAAEAGVSAAESTLPTLHTSSTVSPLPPATTTNPEDDPEFAGDGLSREDAERRAHELIQQHQARTKAMDHALALQSGAAAPTAEVSMTEASFSFAPLAHSLHILTKCSFMFS